MSETAVHVIGNVLIIITALGATLSVMVYARVPWSHLPMGRHLMCYMVVIAAVLDLSVLRIMFGDSPEFQLVRLVVFVGMPVVVWWRLVLLVLAQRDRVDLERPPPV